ncbi:outer membrane beta-barrel protein [Ottowia sp.]|uniref:outer membrane beta-barrel protein n=1 Tax=Ottowia sp. TaxID=1898956 RepID=UPI0025DD4130|nr:outer membrane beta-barrel protein [Ottowia sp.]MBK6616175.1 outer membrane beta-barrel protein [Ottowia sp.]
MKITKFSLLAAAALCLCGSAMAQGYVGIAAGPSHFSLDCTGATSCDNNDTAFKVVGGYSFGNGFSAELGYVSFGKAKAADSSVTAEMKAAGPTLGIAYQHQFNREWGTGVRLGVSNMKTTMSGTVSGLGSATLSETNATPYYGFAVNYMLAKNWKVEAGLDFSKAEIRSEKGTVRALTLGAAYAF